MEKIMNKLYTLLMITLLTGCIFSKSDENHKEYFTIKENTPLLEQKYEKPGPKYYPDNNFIYHENDIIIVAGSEMGRITKHGEMKWKVKLAPTKRSKSFIALFLLKLKNYIYFK